MFVRSLQFPIYENGKYEETHEDDTRCLQLLGVHVVSGKSRLISVACITLLKHLNDYSRVMQIKLKLSSFFFIFTAVPKKNVCTST